MRVYGTSLVFDGISVMDEEDGPTVVEVMVLDLPDILNPNTTDDLAILEE